jgi:hypothetical protein
MSDAVTEFRLDRLESDVRDIKATLGRLEPLINRIDATLPFLATKAELADKPGKTFLVGAIGVLIATYALGLAGVAALPVLRSLLHLP